MANHDILSRTPFCLFLKSHHMDLAEGQFKNSKTGEEFTKFSVGGHWLNWGPSIGELSLAELKAQRHDLQVIELLLSEEEKKEKVKQGLKPECFILCKQGDLPSNIRRIDVSDWD